MGRPKQLLAYAGVSLVEHAARVALDSGAAEVIVVIGSEAGKTQQALDNLPVRILINEEWQEGMGTSIRVGASAISDRPEAVVITLCDQPKITAEHIRSLAEHAMSSHASIAATSYGAVTGAPSAFTRKLFPRLLALKGDSGAKDIIRSSTMPIKVVPFEPGAIDVDTDKDYMELLSDQLA